MERPIPGERAGRLLSSLPEFGGKAFGRSLSLRHNFAWTLLGNVCYAASQWAILIVLTKTTSPEVVGRFALALAVTGPIIIFASLQLRSVQVTDAAREYAFGDYLALRLGTVVLALAIIAVVAMGGGFRWEVAAVILAMGFARCIEAVSEVYLGLFQSHERMDLVSRSTILKATLSLAGFTAGLFATGSLVGAVAGLATAWFLVFLLFDFRQGREFAPAGALARSLAQPRRLFALAWLALPLGIGSVLAALEINVPRYFIERQFGERELGIFAAMAYIAAIGGQLINALGQSASPRLAQYHAAGDRKAFHRLLLKLVGAGLTIGAAAFLLTLVLGRDLLARVYTAEYAEHYRVLVWLMAAAGITFGYIFLGTGLNALRVFRPRVPIHLLTLSILILTCFLLGSRSGLIGVAWAVCISQVVAAAAYLIVILGVWSKPARTNQQ